MCLVLPDEPQILHQKRVTVMSERFLKGRLLVEKRERRQEEAEGFSLTEETRSLYEHQKHKLIRGNQKKSFGAQ